MDRRAFFTTGLGASVLAGTTLGMGGRRGLLAGVPAGDSGAPDLVAVRGGEPDVMFDRGIKALGGIGAFVKKGQTVVVKPNIGWDVSPERAGNTHPKLVSRIVKACYEAGAKKVYVFDHTCDDWQRCYTNSGIERAAKDAGATVVAGNSESYYQEVKIPGGTELKEAKEHELLLSSDVFINVPVLKSHSGARLTIGHEEPDGHRVGSRCLAQVRSPPVHCGLCCVPQTYAQHRGRVLCDEAERPARSIGRGRDHDEGPDPFRGHGRSGRGVSKAVRHGTRCRAAYRAGRGQEGRPQRSGKP